MNRNFFTQPPALEVAYPPSFDDDQTLLLPIKPEDDGAESETRQSIVQAATIDGIGDFYASFSGLTGIALGTPFPHVTLFTKGDSPKSAIGIGIASAEAFQAMPHEPLILS